MSYSEFLNRINDFVGHVVEFTSRFKENGKTFKTQRFVWDSKEFGEFKEDSLVEIIKVELIKQQLFNSNVWRIRIDKVIKKDMKIIVNNDEIRERCDTAIKAVIEFQAKHGITDSR